MTIGRWAYRVLISTMDWSALRRTAKKRTDPLEKNDPVDNGVPKNTDPMMRAWATWLKMTALEADGVSQTQRDGMARLTVLMPDHSRSFDTLVSYRGGFA